SAGGVHYDKSFWSVLLLQKEVALRLQRNIQKFLNGEPIESALSRIRTQDRERLQALVPILEKFIEEHTATFDRLANVPKEAWQSSVGSAFITTQKRYNLSDAQVSELRNWLVNLGNEIFSRFTPKILSEPRAHYEDAVYQFFMKPSPGDFYHKLENGNYYVGFSLARASYGALKSLTYPFPLTPEIVMSLQKFRD
ncbi:MAG: hypothetical protein K2X47_16425, partial [Bdellovibrionales bacterium]|nr:hypothetical protein [Bdellovibrionales bacterium]